MISFMVLSAPRSGSTWAANWLTTEHQICLHDPVLENGVEQLEVLPFVRRYGLACTGLPLLTDWVNRQQCPKVVLHRDLDEVNASLVAIGLSPLSKAWDGGVLERIEGWHVHYKDLFRPGTARAIWQHLLGHGTPFDGTRHMMLASMHIDPHFPRVRIDHERTREFRAEISKALS